MIYILVNGILLKALANGCWVQLSGEFHPVGRAVTPFTSFQDPLCVHNVMLPF